MSELPDPLIGRVLQDTWRIEVFVARGSMGSVYRGVNHHCGTPVAVKVLNPEFLHDEEIRERFRREATVSSRCDSTHLVRVLDFVTDADGYVCLVMEWLHGETIAAYLKRKGRLGVPEAVGIVGEIGEGLHEAHLSGIVHRDLKPGNIFLAETGRAGLLVPKIVDFGISKILEAGAALTATATMMGTPHYMPVEQFDNSKDVDQRADIYALGVITYELVAGRRPYRGMTPMAILNQVATAEPPPLPEDVPEAVARVILKAMARRAEDRFPAVLEYCEALLEAATQAGLAPDPATQPRATLGLAPTTGALTALPAPPLWQRWLARHQRLVLGLAVALAVVAVGVGLWVGLGSRGGGADRPGSAAPPPSETLGRLTGLRSPPGSGARGLAVDAVGVRALATRGSRGWQRWDLAAGRAEAGGDAGPEGARVSGLALSPDGRWQALGLGVGGVALDEVAGPRRHRLRPGDGQPVSAIAFSADGNRLLTGSDGGALVLWDVRSGRRLAMLAAAGKGVTALALDGDGGRALVGRTDGTLAYWNNHGRRVLAQLPIHRAAVTGVALTPAGDRGASADGGGTTRLWRFPAGTPGTVLLGHHGAVTGIAISEDGSVLLTGGADGTARLWSADGRLLALARLPGPVGAVALAEGGALRLVGGPGFPLQVYREARPPARSARRGVGARR